MMMIVKMAKNGFFDLENETPRGGQMLPSLCIFMQWVRIALQAGVFNNFSASIALGDRIQIPLPGWMQNHSQSGVCALLRCSKEPTKTVLLF